MPFFSFIPFTYIYLVSLRYKERMYYSSQLLFLFLSIFIQLSNAQPGGPQGTSWLYPHDFRTAKLLCDPFSTPRAEEICVRACRSDNDCKYRSAQANPNIDTVTSIGSGWREVDRRASGLPLAGHLWDAYDPYTSIKKPEFLDWMCNKTLGYCSPYTDNGCNWGYKRVRIPLTFSLYYDRMLNIPQDQNYYIYKKESYGSLVTYGRYIYGQGINEDILDERLLMTSYMCQCRIEEVYGSVCGKGKCIRTLDQTFDASVEVSTSNIQFATAYKAYSGTFSINSKWYLRSLYSFAYPGIFQPGPPGTEIVNTLEQIYDYTYTVCDCPEGTHGTTCNNVIDNCGTLYCEGRGICAKEIDALSTSLIQETILSQSSTSKLYDDRGAALYINVPDKFSYLNYIPNYEYWMKREQAPIYMALTNLIAPPIQDLYSVRTCFCEDGYLSTNDASSSPFINSDSNSQLIMYPNVKAGCNSVDFSYICCNKNKGVWPLYNIGKEELKLPVKFEELCLPDSGIQGDIQHPCLGSSCYGFNCELTCSDMCSGNPLDTFSSCTYPTNWPEADASLYNLCLTCKPGTGPPASSPSTWTRRIRATTIYSNIMRYCNLIYSKPHNNPNGAEEQCGGYGYSLNLDRVASILGLNRTLIQVIRRTNSMELDFNPLKLIDSYVNKVSDVYIDKDDEPRLIELHPAFVGVSISMSQWEDYARFYYSENVNVPCACAEGYVNNDAGSCIPDACLEWTSVHVSDKSGIPPNGLTCGGATRSYQGCKFTSTSRTCTCREGFAGLACEQVLCAHANGSGCSSNGYCDKEFNQCVCKPGYIGIACEIKMESATPCGGNGQQRKSFPSPSYEQDTDYLIPEDINVQVKYL